MKKISLFVSLSFLVLFLLIGCVKREAHLVKYGDDNNWVKYNRDNYRNAYLYKKLNIKKDGGNYIVQVLVKKVFSDKGREQEIQSRIKDGLSTEGYDKLSYIVSLGDIDCNKRMKQTLSLTRYDTDNKVLNSWNYDRKWEYIVPESQGDKLRKKVCE